MSPKYRYSIVACARWEERFIVEWLNYYRAIGFDHVYLYCNDDDPTLLYEKVFPYTQGLEPFVTFRFFPFQGQQTHMYTHFLKSSRDQTEWLAFLDIDEFIKLGRHSTIDEFVGFFDKEIDCVVFNYIYFGPNGHKTCPDGNVLSLYTRREASINSFTKYLIKSSAFGGPRLDDPNQGFAFWHLPQDKVCRPIKIVNVLGEDMANYDIQSRDFVDDSERRRKLLATAIIHHYAFRSEEAFVDRVRRGLKGPFSAQQRWKNLRENGDEFESFLSLINNVEDLSLANFWQEFYSKRASSTNVIPAPVGTIVSRGKKAAQSSLSEWSIGETPEDDASLALKEGEIDGCYKFHTNSENGAWWLVDLEEVCNISEVRLYNRFDDLAFAARAVPFKIEIGTTEKDLIEHYRHSIKSGVFGGVDGYPFIWHPSHEVRGRYVRIALIGENFLHLDKVEVYALP